LSFTGYELAITITYWTILHDFTWKLGALKAQLYTFIEGTSSYLAHPVQFRHTSSIAVGANVFLHSGAFFAGDAANTDFHIIRNRNFSFLFGLYFCAALKAENSVIWVFLATVRAADRFLVKGLLYVLACGLKSFLYFLGCHREGFLKFLTHFV
jgi:hypothetical protein